SDSRLPMAVRVQSVDQRYVPYERQQSWSLPGSLWTCKQQPSPRGRRTSDTQRSGQSSCNRSLRQVPPGLASADGNASEAFLGSDKLGRLHKPPTEHHSDRQRSPLLNPRRDI